MFKKKPCSSPVPKPHGANLASVLDSPLLLSSLPRGSLCSQFAFLGDTAPLNLLPMGYPWHGATHGDSSLPLSLPWAQALLWWPMLPADSWPWPMLFPDGHPANCHMLPTSGWSYKFYFYALGNRLYLVILFLTVLKLHDGRTSPKIDTRVLHKYYQNTSEMIQEYRRNDIKILKKWYQNISEIMLEYLRNIRLPLGF